jgi:uncharacterized protein (DUF2141 family)
MSTVSRRRLLFSLAAAPLLPAEGSSGKLSVQITGFRNTKGTTKIALWRGPDGFPSKVNKIFKAGTAEIQGSAATISFEGVPAGQYAVSVFHDENGNGKLDGNAIGIPKEGYGFSNNAKSKFGPPGYKACEFAGTGTDQTITIELTYFKF